MSKRTVKEIAESILKDGEIIKSITTFSGVTYVVKAFGHTYRIENAYGAKPKITQLSEVAS